MSDPQEPLSLIIGEIDYFKVYKSYYGDKKANQCLQQVAQAFTHLITSEDMLVACYGDAQFAVILPRIDKSAAVEVAKNIQAQVQDLNIEFNIPDYYGFPDSVVTVSLGLITTMLTANTDIDDLIFRTEKALESVQIIGGNSLKSV